MGHDEGRFGRISRPKRCWAPPGMRPHVPTPRGARVGLYLCRRCPWSGFDDLVSVTDLANTAMMNRFLKHVSQSFEKYCSVMQVDQAGWHRSKELLVPANIRLIEQPAYSPEVNPVEHLWEELREK